MTNSPRLRLTIRSHPARGEWIEIHQEHISIIWEQSHPARGEWIEINLTIVGGPKYNVSHPARGEWIEILLCAGVYFSGTVSPREG